MGCTSAIVFTCTYTVELALPLSRLMDALIASKFKQALAPVHASDLPHFLFLKDVLLSLGTL